MDGLFGGYLRSGLMASTAIVCMATATPAMAQTRNFDVPAQAAARGVATFARQADIQLLISARDAQGRRTNAVRGSFNVEQALQQLLAGTGLRAQPTGAQTWSVVPVSGEVEAGGAAADSESADAGATPEILVVGHIPTMNADIRRTEDDTQPYVVITNEEIVRSGALSLDDFLMNRLPMNSQRQAAINIPDTTIQAGIGQIDLRGLGANQTLILVDGRRIASVATGTTLAQPSIAGIPPSAVERIEILPSTGSGIYGGSATGGVINIILRRNYSGVDIEASYGITSRGDAPQHRLNAVGGFSLEGGRTRIMLTASHSEQGSLISSERDFALHAGELFLRNDTVGTALRSRIFGNTPNIFSTNGANLVLDNGAPLNSQFTFVPLGYLGSGQDSGAALIPNAGRLSLRDSTEVLQRSFSSEALGLNLRRTFTSAVEAYLDIAWNRNRTTLPVPQKTRITLAATSVDNPFQQPIAITIPLPNFTLLTKNAVESARANAGVIFQLPFSWRGSLEYGWSWTNTSVISRGLVTTAAGANSILNAGAISNPSLLDNSPSLFRTREATSDFDNTLQNLSLRLSGPIVRLPAGRATLSALIEQRHENVDAALTASRLTSPETTTFTWFPAANQRVRSAYGEVRVPLISADNEAPVVRNLEVMFALRRDEYRSRYAGAGFRIPSSTGPFPTVTYFTNNFESLDYTAGLTYSPIRDLTLRGSYATGFLPPGLSGIRQDRFQFPVGNVVSAVVDPRRGGQILTGDSAGLITLASGGNPNAQPEQSSSLSFGAILTPSFVEGLRLSVDYTRIRKNDELTSPTAQFIVNQEADFPDRVIRGPSLPGDAPGLPGPIIFLDTSALNISTTNLAAIDFQLDYTFRTRTLGRWHFYVIGSRQLAFDRQALPSLPIVDLQAFSDGILKWRGNMGIDWSAGRWNVGWNMQYYHSYPLLGAADAGDQFSASLLLIPQGSDRIRRQVYHDVYVRYRVGNEFGTALRGVDVSFGIQNLFDEEPPLFVAFTGAASYGDPRLRRFLFTVSKRFGS